MKDKYFLTSRHGDCGSTVMFHNHGEKGYGSDLNKLEVYSKENAQKRHNQFGRGSLPLLVDKVMTSCKRRVDMQYIDIAKGAPRFDKQITVFSCGGVYNGNDIRFKAENGYTFNLDDALAKPLSEWADLGCSLVPWSLAYLADKSRITFQRESVNTRSMCRGVKLERIRKTQDSGKTRWNCPACGRISWQYNPYDFDGCNDWGCEEHR